LKQLLAIFIFFCFSSACFAQAEAKKDLLLEMAMERFGDLKNKGVWWLKDMKGFLDNTHEIRMVLATDNVKFKGAYEILSSRQRFYLEGEHTGEQIVLIEIDSLDNPTGSIRGDMNDDKFYCEWSTTKSKDAMPMFLYHNAPSPNPCGNVGWGHFFNVKSTIVDSIKSIAIFKKEMDAYMDIRSKHCVRRYNLECENDACTMLRHLPSSLMDQEEMIIDLRNNKIQFISIEGKNSIDILPKKSLYFNCNTYMDFDEKFSFLFPLTSDKKFNEYIYALAVDKYMGIGNHEYQSHEVVSYSDRNIHMEYGDLKVDWFSDTLISGVFMFQSSKTHEVTEVPFSYHFMKKRPIEWKDIFIEKFSFFEEKKKFISDYKKKKDNNQDEDYFKDQEYNIVTFTPDGFKCKTVFNTLYGEDAIVIPYRYFSSFYKKNAILK
jgi:hypothetical protein